MAESSVKTGLPLPGVTLVASRQTVDEAYARLAVGIQSIVAEAEINESECVLLGVMTGGMVPLVRLAELVEGDYLMDYCHVSRYRGELTGGNLEWLQAPHIELTGKTVVIIDDIFDEGVTLDYVAAACHSLGAGRVVTVVLVRKLHDRVKTKMCPDLVGLEVGDHFVFGCGMDYRNRWRHLSAIYALPFGQESAS
jgi:hypoxanthine phosphoribosyltransferase